MKQNIKNIGAFLLTIVVLVSTMSFTIHNKYCSGNLIDTTLLLKSDFFEISENKDCCLIAELCCDYEQIVIDGQDELQFRTVDFSLLKKQFFVVDLPKLHLFSFKITNYAVALRKEYIPPNLIVDKQAILQTFII